MWKYITGFRFEYRINEEGIVEKKYSNGEWKQMHPYLNNKRFVINMWVTDTYRKPVAIIRLMDEYFFNSYAKKNGLCITHKNGAKADCSVYNLEFVNRHTLNKRNSARARSKPVVKVNKNKEPVEWYRSCKDAAKKNHMSETAMYLRLHDMLLDPYRLEDYTYHYEEEVTYVRGKVHKKPKVEKKNEDGNAAFG